MSGRGVLRSEPWPFRSHRTMADVLRDEMLARVTAMLRDPRWSGLALELRVDRVRRALRLDAAREIAS
jgi:hypothetical protein